VTPLMGRSAQLAWIEEQLTAGGSVVIAGEAGVGKTRLMTEVVDRMAALGRPVSRIVAASAGAALPLAPLAHLLPADIDPEGGVAALHQALDAFRARGEAQRLVIGVDDAHHLDELSLLVVQQGIAADVIQIVATVRTGETVTAAVEQLWRSPGGARLDLQPLDPAATAALVEAVLRGPVDAATHVLIDESASGSPLMILELVAHGQASGPSWRQRACGTGTEISA
jgi:predicted ATPase